MISYFAPGAVLNLVLMALTAWLGLRAQAWAEHGDTPRRWLVFLLSLLGLFLALMWLVPPDLLPGFALTPLCWTLALGTLAALFAHLLAFRAVWVRRDLLILVPGLLVNGALLAAAASRDSIMIGFILVVAALVIALVWQAWPWLARRRLSAALAVSVLFGLLAAWTLIPSAWLLVAPDAFRGIYFTIFYSLWPCLAPALAARLAYDLVNAEGRRALPLITIAALLLGTGYIIVAAAIEDAATDGLTALFTFTSIAAPASAAAGMLAAWSSTGWRRWAAAAGLVLGSWAILAGAYELGWSLKPQALTVARARVINQAVLRYQAAIGRYPAALSDVGPWPSWRIFEPMIYWGQTWCYQGGADYYRLGYVSSPIAGVPIEFISIQVHAQAGEPPQAGWECDEPLARVLHAAPTYRMPPPTSPAAGLP